MEKNEFALLRSKEIIAILDGDKEFGDMTFEDKYGNEKNIKIAIDVYKRQVLALLSEESFLKYSIIKSS